MDYSVNSTYFSGTELKVLHSVFSSCSFDKEELIKHGLSKREATEFLEKLDKIKESK